MQSAFHDDLAGPCPDVCQKMGDSRIAREERIQIWKAFQASSHIHTWEYSQRRLMQEIFPDVFLGPFGAATADQMGSLVSARITHIVCICDPMEKKIVKPRFPGEFTYLVVEIKESTLESVLPHVYKLIEFIHEAMAVGGRVLIHGNCGSCRSAALTCGFLMNELQCSADDAFYCLRKIRANVREYEPFVQQLREFEAIIQARSVVPANHSGTSHKRALTEGEADNSSSSPFKRVANPRIDSQESSSME